MSGIAVVASTQDAKFAEDVRAGLQAAGLDASVSQSLPKAADSQVVLIWSAALEAGHAIDAQALIGLWSEDRLLVARRDATLLPLGLRDLPSLAPEATGKDIVDAVRPDTVVGSLGDLSSLAIPAASVMVGATEGIETTGDQEVELELWRAIRDGDDPDDFELYVQQYPTGIYAALAKRKLAKLRGSVPEDSGAAELEKRELEEAATREVGVKQKLAEKKARFEAQLAAKETVYEKSVVERLPKSKGAALAAKAEVAKPEADQKKELAEAPKPKGPIGMVVVAIVAIAIAAGGTWYYFNKSSIERQAALTMALESATKATQELREAHVREFEALKALEQARAAEDAARKAGDPEKLKEAQEVAKRADAEAAKQAEVVKQREAAAADARKKAQESAASAKQAAAKASVPEKVAVAAVAPKAEAPKAVAKAPEPVAKAPEPVAEAPAPVAKAAEPPKAKTRSEREREEDDRLASQAVLKKGVPVTAAPATTTAAEPQATSAPEYDALYQQAMAMEQDGNARNAIRIYRRAARAGSGKAAKRLGEIYDRGVPGVSRDYAESLQWYETARQLGERIETLGSRGGPEAPVVAAPAPAPAVREPVKAAPVPAAKSAPVPEPVKAAEPAPVPAPAPTPDPPKSAAPVPSPAPAPETKPGWFSLRGLLIALLVLALIAWRRSRRRGKAAARQAQRQFVAATGSSTAQAAVLIAALSENASSDGTATDECVRILRECADAAKGRVIKTRENEVVCSFPSTDAAADAAIRMQEAIAELKPVGSSKIGLRIGFNYGPIVEQADGDVFGDAVNAASRLSHVAVKGQIITARDTVMLMTPMLKSATRKIMAIQIKGKAAEVEVYELMWRQSEDATTMAGARPVYRPGKAAGQAAPGDSMLFVSYSHKDRPRVEPIVSVIEEMGRRVWMDRSDITGQTGWAGQIVRAIRECRAVVLMASPNSYGSDQVVRELYLAMNHRKTIVPIEIEPAEMPDELQYILAPFQHHRLSAGETRAVLGRALAAV